MKGTCILPARFVSRFVLFALLTIVVPTNASAQLMISEFRLHGMNGPLDEFIEIANPNGIPFTVTATSGTGFGVAASDGVLRCTIPNGTVIPGHGHFLCVNSSGYSFASYPEASATSSTGDASYTTDIPLNVGIALFNNNIPANFTLANRFDAVGSSSEANTLYKEGTGYAPITAFVMDYSFVRDQCGKGGDPNNSGTCSQMGVLKDTGNNATDFVFVDPNGTNAGAGQRLGAAGPENLSAPVTDPSSIPNVALDPCVSNSSAPNFVRDFTSDPANNSTFGTLDIRRTFTNNTGGSLTRLRFRIVDLTTFPAASGVADLRPRTSANVVVTVDRPPCGVGTSGITVQGTTLEVDNTAPSFGQPNGGGFDSSMSAGTVTLGTPLANGASVDLRFLFGIQQTGVVRVAIVIEGLPKGGGPQNFFVLNCAGTDAGPCVTRTFLKGDFNADSKSDVIWRKSTTGEDAMWLMNGAAISSPSALPTVSDTNWKMSGAGDFDGDGKADVIWWHALTGQVAVWLMNGTSVATPAIVTTVADTNWKIAGVGDVDGDGKSDVVWRNSATGQVVVYLMNGTSVSSTGTAGTVSDLNWNIAGVGDFDHDGRSDLFWRNGSTGQNVIWFMNGTTVTLAVFTSTVTDVNYKVVGVGDTNLDGKSDIFWWNQSTGAVVWWGKNFNTVTSPTLITTVSDLNWHVEAVGDFDADGKADLLWRKVSTGEVVVWLMTGASIKSAASVTTVSDLNWSAVAPK